ncbi:DUF4342 domain-containing protein [Actinosynnema sp. NPDC002837]
MTSPATPGASCAAGGGVHFGHDAGCPDTVVRAVQATRLDLDDRHAGGWSAKGVDMTEQGDRQAPGVEALTDKIRQLVHEGNTRRVVVRNGKGEPVLDIPVTAGVVAAVAAPMVTAVAAFAALAGPWSVGVERPEPTAPTDGDPGTTASATTDTETGTAAADGGTTAGGTADTDTAAAAGTGTAGTDATEADTAGTGTTADREAGTSADAGTDSGTAGTAAEGDTGTGTVPPVKG